MGWNPFQRLSESPTNPGAKKPARKPDVADLYRGSAGAGDGDAVLSGLDEKLRQAYFWVANTAIICPYYDIEFNDGPPQVFYMGDTKSRLTLPSAQSYASFVLIPILNLAVRRRCLLVGGPGRGKTASAFLMGILAGYSIKEVKRAVQHGQPQMTVSDLLGNPLPADMVKAESMDQIRIAWRKWLAMRVKVIDEYNRIPTRTQSALLTVLADNYAEMLDQVYECPEAAWYLTANDDAGGGTYQVIEALRDRIDVVVKAPHFNPRFLKELLARVEGEVAPERMVPPGIVFTEAELDKIHAEILAVSIPEPVRRRLEFFTAHFEYLEPAAEQFEYKTKDTVKLVGADYRAVAGRDTGRDKAKDLGSQTKNGLSVRALMTVFIFTKALAFFRGDNVALLDDLRQILPFVLHDKLVPDLESPFFDEPGNAALRTDRVSWIRRLFDLSSAEYDRLDLDANDPLVELDAELAAGLDGVSEKDVRTRLVRVERLLGEWSKARKMYGHLYNDVLKLKYLHQRYTNYLRWLRWKGQP